MAGLGDDPSFSPGGYTIAFTICQDIWKVNNDGTGLTNLTRNRNHATYAWVGHPTYSPDGSKMAFSADPGSAGGAGAIYLMNSDGTNQRRLASYPSEYYQALRWSPGGSKIAFLRSDYDYPNGGLANQLGVANSDGTNQHLVATAGPNDAPFDGLDYSPDATKLIFEDNTYGISTINANGTGRAPLPNGLYSILGPVYSPGGTKIALSDGGRTYQIATANTAGPGETRLTNSRSRTGDVEPSWGRNPLFLFRWHIDPSLLRPNYPAIVSGTFTDKGGDLVPNAGLTLWQRPEGTNNYTQVQGASATTAKDGTFTFGKIYPKTSTYYQVRYSGSDKRDIPAVYSGAKEVVVK